MFELWSASERYIYEILKNAAYFQGARGEKCFVVGIDGSVM